MKEPVRGRQPSRLANLKLGAALVTPIAAIVLMNW